MFQRVEWYVCLAYYNSDDLVAFFIRKMCRALSLAKYVTKGSAIKEKIKALWEVAELQANSRVIGWTRCVLLTCAFSANVRWLYKLFNLSCQSFLTCSESIMITSTSQDLISGIKWLPHGLHIVDIHLSYSLLLLLFSLLRREEAGDLKMGLGESREKGKVCWIWYPAFKPWLQMCMIEEVTSFTEVSLILKWLSG